MPKLNRPHTRGRRLRIPSFFSTRLKQRTMPPRAEPSVEKFTHWGHRCRRFGRRRTVFRPGSWW
jgi:hypothetical protein